MLRNQYFYARYFNAEGGESSSDTKQETVDTSDSKDTTSSEDAIKAAVEKAVADAVAGLRKKNEEVIGDNKKLKSELANLKTKPTLTEEEHANYLALKERIERDELLKALSEGKSEEVIEKVTRKTRVEYDAKLAAEVEAAAKVKADAESWRVKYEKTRIENEIQRAAAGSVKPEYVELISRIVAERVRISDDAVRIVDDTGTVQNNASGTKPLTVSDYVESLRGAYKDLFVVSTGGGAAGSSTKATGAANKTKMAAELAGELPFQDYERLRKEGRI
jgi:hypothetical protein